MRGVCGSEAEHKKAKWLACVVSVSGLFCGEMFDLHGCCFSFVVEEGNFESFHRLQETVVSIHDGVLRKGIKMCFSIIYYKMAD